MTGGKRNLRFAQERFLVAPMLCIVRIIRSIGMTGTLKS